MPWCPNCKTEYREGITLCSDCNTDLVENLEEVSDYVVLSPLEKEEVAQKLVKYLTYSNIESYYEYLEKELCYPVYVQEPELEKAKKAFNAFYAVELEAKDVFTDTIDSDSSLDSEDASEIHDLENLLNLEEENITSSPSRAQLEEEEKDNITSMMYDGGAYEKRAEKSKELRSTAITFFVFGIGGLLLVILNAAGFVSIINGTLAYIVMTGLFLAFLAIGANSVTRAKKTAKEAIEEEEKITKINHYLKENVTEQVILSMKEEKLSDEANFIKIMDGIKSMVTSEFGSIDPAFLDYVVEEFYNNHFEE